MIREGLERPSTWALLAFSGGEPAGHVAITQAREREEPRPDIPGLAHFWMLFVRPPWWGSGLAARLNGLAVERGRRARLRRDAPAHARGEHACPGLLRARGLAHRRRGDPGADARARPRGVPPRSVRIRRRAPPPPASRRPDALRSRRAADRGGRRALPRLLGHPRRAPAALLALDLPGVGVRRPGVADRHQGARPPDPVLRAGVGDHHARHHRRPARAAGGRGRARRRARDRRRRPAR